jgi:hypothetical protein
MAMTTADAWRRKRAIDKTITKILNSDLPAETKLAMIKAQNAKLKAINKELAS